MIKRALALISLATPTVASDFSLELPIDCELGETCHIQQFVDHDPSPGASDFSCGTLSYDTHNGTDFALPDLAAMNAGVDVLAAAPGRVVAIRDGMADQLFTTETAANVEGRECGNGVVIEHESGWRTQYCHLKQGSVIVARGARVETGTVLGEVGLSGKTQFPHVHLTLRKNDQIVDPFAPDGRQICGPQERTLWADPPAFQPGGIIRAGFADAAPSYDAIKSGQAGLERVAAEAPVLAIWVHVFGARQGDLYEIEVTGPNGPFLTETFEQERTQAQSFRFAGKRLRAEGWPEGQYNATLRLIRDDTVIDAQQLSTTVR